MKSPPLSEQNGVEIKQKRLEIRKTYLLEDSRQWSSSSPRISWKFIAHATRIGQNFAKHSGSIAHV
jgi:RNA recognition motif-containing protein